MADYCELHRYTRGHYHSIPCRHSDMGASASPSIQCSERQKRTTNDDPTPGLRQLDAVRSDYRHDKSSLGAEKRNRALDR